jgi:type IV secretory pathway VirB10-like protein
MQRVVALACAALAFGMVASPLGAQQAPTQQMGQNEPVPRTQQSTPEAAQPPPAPEAEPLPPPFPPMPSARPSHRWVDIGDHHARRVRSHARPRHHQATRTQHRRADAHHRPADKARLAGQFSRRTIRSCHGMNYRQIIRHDSCQLLMRQELAATAHRHHHATHRHKAAAHRHKARHHQEVRQRKR